MTEPEVAAIEEPDVVTLDIPLARGSGFEVLRAIAKKRGYATSLALPDLEDAPRGGLQSQNI